MFLELEQVDVSAHMHIGAALIFDPLPGGGAPDIGDFWSHRLDRSRPLLSELQAPGPVSVQS
jgi:hypothetical protein